MDHRSCRDRYASAVSSSDLTPRAGSVLDPLDVLGAAGMAAQRQPLGMMLQRLRAEPHGSHRDRASDELAALLCSNVFSAAQSVTLPSCTMRQA